MKLLKQTKYYLKENILFVSLITIYLPLFNYYKILNQNGGHNFMTADWLINYKYGYVNRGLIGTLIVPLFDDGKALLIFLTYILIFTYVLIFYFLNISFKRSSEKFITAALIFSPAGFLLLVYDSQASFRKELIGILGLFILLSSVNTKHFKKNLKISGFILTIGIFSHSINLFFIPTILLLLYRYQKTRNIFDYLVFLFPALLFFATNFLFRPSEQKLFAIKNNMCSQIYELGLEKLCGYGSFDFITWDLNAHYVVTQNYIINLNRENYFIYILFFILSLVPFELKKKIISLFQEFLIIGVTFIPLFLIAIDWGRWIHIISICYLSIYLIRDKHVINSNLKYLLFLYPFLFRMEHCCNTQFELSTSYFMSNFRYIIWNFTNLFSIF